MNYFRRTLLVGLGGSGQLILTQVKRHFLEVYGQVPPAIRFLALDTDATRTTLKLRTGDGECRLSESEFFHLKVEDPMTFLASSPAVQDWFVTAGPVSAIQYGAGGIRQNGRLALFHHIVDIESRLTDIITSITAGDMKIKMESAVTTQVVADAETGAMVVKTKNAGYQVLDRPMEVYVCGSLAGGTGSGCFLDIGILLRHLVSGAHVHGFFLMDWIYHSKPFTHRVAGNAYAALCELDYLQGTQTNLRKPYTVKYGSRVLEVKVPPYTLFHVLDGRNSYGENINDVGQLCDVVARGIFLSIGSMGEKVTSVVDNVLAHIGAQDPKTWDGRPARYSSYGVSSMCYPARLIHRIESLEGALELCHAAQKKAKGAGAAGAAGDVKVSESAAAQASAILTDMNLNRQAVQNAMGKVPAAQFPVGMSMISDRSFPNALRNAMDNAEKKMRDAVKTSIEAHGLGFRMNIENTLKTALDKQRGKLKKSSATLRALTDALTAKIGVWASEAAAELQAADAKIGDKDSGLRKDVNTLIGTAAQAWNLPVIANPRAKAVKNCCQQVADLLAEVWKHDVLKAEKEFYDALLVLLEKAQPDKVVAASATEMELLKAGDALAGQLERARIERKTLQEDPSTVLIGRGTAVMRSQATADIMTEIEELSRGDSNSFFEDFETASGINNVEDYSKAALERADGLAGLFRTYVEDQLKDLGEVDVLTALEAAANSNPNGEKREDYLERQFSHLIRLAGPLWSVRSALVSGERRPHYEDLLVMGCPNADIAQTKFGPQVDNARQGFQLPIKVDYMSIQDKERIWLLDFSAALPLYFLTGLDDSKKLYEEGMTPPYHLDRRLEIEIPDLFPPQERDNMTLRHLALAIIRNVEVVHDEYMRLKGGRGHVFKCTLPGIAAHTDGEKFKQWTRFLDMYAELRDGYDDKRPDNIIDLVHNALLPKLAAMLKDDTLRPRLQAEVTEQIAAFKEKVESRDFSRLVSARLTSREMRDLREFLALAAALEPRIGQLSLDAVEAAVEKLLGGGTAVQAAFEADRDASVAGTATGA